jgi:hypothetical protein
LAQGVGNPKADGMRDFSDRVIDYDLYRDLGVLPLDPKKRTWDPRPILGGNVEVRHGRELITQDVYCLSAHQLTSVMCTMTSLALPADGCPDVLQGFKYPRRLRTGRPLTADNKETSPAGLGGKPWVGQDEDFDDTKSVRQGATVRKTALVRS